MLKGLLLFPSFLFSINPKTLRARSLTNEEKDSVTLNSLLTDILIGIMLGDG
jgi:hypothetical protein